MRHAFGVREMLRGAECMARGVLDSCMAILVLRGAGTYTEAAGVPVAGTRRSAVGARRGRPARQVS
jgi:hypothetical protein